MKEMMEWVNNIENKLKHISDKINYLHAGIGFHYLEHQQLNHIWLHD